MNEKQYIKVGALNNYIKLLVDDSTFLRHIYLKGEISNYKNHMSGHLYFTLKDEDSKINAIMFRNKVIDLKFKPEDGKKVLVEGHVSCYPSQGTYQFYVDKMEEDGLGNLYVLFEELKNKLAKEGLFDERFKKPIPKYPQKIGIITAPSGAAIKDILSTLKRRYPICETILFPALVQGASSSADIAKQINVAQNYDLDVLIVGRGGGSIEDLWAFNEEVVARAIFASKIPIISAVGHEIDYTIADFVADLRAPTPTGAAEMAVPTIDFVKKTIRNQELQINHFMKQKIDFLKHQFEQLNSSYILNNPMKLYEVKMQKLDYQLEHLNGFMTQFLKKQRNSFDLITSAYILKNPLQLYQNKKEQISHSQKSLQQAIKQIIDQKQQKLLFELNTVKLVNPLNILEKGYSLVTLNENVVKSSKDLKIHDEISIQFKEGSVKASIKEVK